MHQLRRSHAHVRKRTALIQDGIDGCEKEFRYNLDTSLECDFSLTFRRRHGELSSA